MMFFGYRRDKIDGWSIIEAIFRCWRDDSVWISWFRVFKVDFGQHWISNNNNYAGLYNTKIN